MRHFRAGHADRAGTASRCGGTRAMNHIHAVLAALSRLAAGEAAAFV